MKCHFFHLMPWPDLPDDFQQKYRSVWVDVPSHLYDPVRGHEVYNDYLDELEFAADAGFDGICVNEHHSNAYGLMPSPNLMAAALARRTSDAALVVMGNSLALYNPPIRVAEEFAMLDVISGGRLVAGFPVGSSMDTNYAYGQTPIDLREKYQEAHDLIIRAWTDPDVFTWNGKYTQLRYVNTWPKPIQKPHPPVWIPGGGSIETWDWVLERDYVYCYLSYFGYMRAEAVMKKFWARADHFGVDHNPYRAGFLQFVGVSDTDEEAEADYAEAADYFYNRCLHVAPGFADAPGYRTLATVKAGMLAQVGAAAAAMRQGLTWKSMVDQGYIIAGSPDTVRRKLEEVAKGLNVGHMMFLLHFGNLSKTAVTKNTRLFTEQVMPHLQKLFPEWEDKWWINPLPASDRRAPNPASTQAAGVQ